MMLHSAGAAADGVTCGVDSLDAEGANFTATPYCETVITRSLFMADDLAYRSVGSIDQADLEVPDSFSYTAIGSGSGFGLMSFGARSLAGIGNTTELSYVKSIGKDLMANGQFNIGEDVTVDDRLRRRLMWWDRDKSPIFGLCSSATKKRHIEWHPGLYRNVSSGPAG